MTKYWQVRIYNPNGDYGISQVSGEMDDVMNIALFYYSLTGCKMLVEAMQQKPYNVTPLSEVFYILYRKPRRGGSGKVKNKSTEVEKTS